MDEVIGFLGIVFLALLTVFIVLALNTCIVYLIWNNVMVDIGLNEITFIQAFLMSILGRALCSEVNIRKGES